MISSLSGILQYKANDHCVIDVSGVGYDVSIALSTFSALPEIGTSIVLHIHTHVREDALQLYGFLDAAERTIFRQLISISGVGPKSALGILSGIPAMDLATAIHHEDVARLTNIPGIGKRTADRIIMELKDKLARTLPHSSMNTAQMQHDELCQALVNLGYTRQAAEAAVRKVSPKTEMPLEQLLRLSLKELATR